MGRAERNRACQFCEHPGTRDCLRVRQHSQRPITQPAYGSADVRIAADALHDCARLCDEAEAAGPGGDGNDGRAFPALPCRPQATVGAGEFQHHLGSFPAGPSPARRRGG